ncbi:MAG: DUF2934 domain-containing protein [Deltaproteobacteria bacterium]
MAETKKGGTKKKGASARTDETGVDEQMLYFMIEKKAYELHQQKGEQHGGDLEDWLEAERITKAEIAAKKQ